MTGDMDKFSKGRPDLLTRSEGLPVGEFGLGLCVYDLLDDWVQMLGPDASRVLQMLPASVEEVVAAISDLSTCASAVSRRLATGLRAWWSWVSSIGTLRAA